MDTVAIAEARTGDASSRRAPRPPSRIQHEILRSELVARLDARFDQRVTTLTAGAGFGKTTALAQAIRLNLTEPQGVDVWVACEAADESESNLAAGIADSLRLAGGPTTDASTSIGGNGPASEIVAGIGSLGPVDVCLIFDDVHEIPSDSSGHHLLADIVRQLPHNGHVVLSSRNELDLPLARLRASGSVHEIGQGDLTLSADDIAALARLHGTDASKADRLAGWPSLVQLALAARPGAATEFLREEIIGALDPGDRVGMLALATLGWGTVSELADVAGAPVDIDHLLRTIPLTFTDGRGRVGVHQLWEETVARVFAAGELADFRRRALATMHRSGDTIRLGSAAARWSDDRWLRRAALDLVAGSWGGLPTALARRWLETAPSETRESPELRLLAAAIRQHEAPDDETLDGTIDELIAEFRRSGQRDGEVRSIALASVTAHGRADHMRLVDVAARARELAGSEDVPALQFLVGSVDAALGSLRGDVEGALRIIADLPIDGVAPEARRLVTRLESMMLMVTGHADRACEVVGRLGESNDSLAEDLSAFLAWQAGRPGRFLTEPLRFDPAAIPSRADQVVYAAEIVAIASGLGNVDVVTQALDWLDAIPRDTLDPRCSAFVAVADVCAATFEDPHGEASSRAISDHLRRHADAARVAQLHLARHPAVGYVTNEQIRASWEDTRPGPSHLENLEAARRLLEARDGSLDTLAPLPTAERAITSFPLPWTVELGLRAHRLGHPGGLELLRRTTDLLGDFARREIDRLADGISRTDLAEIARAVRFALPREAPACVRIDVLGPMRITTGDATIDHADLRRGRVRTVLALLAVRGPLRRDQIIETIWPDSEPAAARRNLRVTLSRMRNVLRIGDPGTTGDEPRLVTDDDSIALAAESLVTTDLAQFRRHVAAAGSAEPTAIDELTAALRLWRGDPLTDLDAACGTETDVEIVRQELVDATLRLGELLHASGRFDEAWRCAERIRAAAPYTERAHRLAVAAQLQRRDRTGVDAAMTATYEMLDDLGVEPEEATQMLLRRAAAFTGRRS